jgi:hypothetical protein
MYDGPSKARDYGNADQSVDEATDLMTVQTAFESDDAADRLDGDMEALGGLDEPSETLEISEYRNLLGDVLEEISDRMGEFNEGIAQRAGLSTADIDAMTHQELALLARYTAQNYPDIFAEVAARYPAVEGMIPTLLDQSDDGGGGSYLGGVASEVLRGGRNA